MVSETADSNRQAMPAPLVWYAAYGSNLLADRLRCYLEGDQARGNDKAEAGCRDQQPPQDERAIFLPHRLYFANRSQRWQRGGVAFLDPDADESATTYCRSWLLTAEQFTDLVRQENGDSALDVDLATLVRDGEQVVGQGWYGGLLHLGDQDGLPVVTCTSPRSVDEASINPPSRPYLTTIIAGLRETFGLNEQGVWKYLRSLRGLEQLEREELKRCYERAEELL